jgi:predicted 3-demethylubiquinone-9 3-methyltransferase (glyoxalase superfamily)
LDTQAEQAAKFCPSIFDNSQIRHVRRYGRAAGDGHGKHLDHDPIQLDRIMV